MARNELTPMPHIGVSSEDGVGVLTIDRPQRFNSLDAETARDLRKAGLWLSRDENVRCVVIRGTNGVFCSGADLKYINARGGKSDADYLRPGGDEEPLTVSEGFKEILEYLHSTISEIKRSPKPFIASVDGVAAAGGFGLAMACDLVFASDRSTFEWAYHKTGLTGAESSTFFLPRLVGLRTAMELVLLNPRLTADDAKALHLVNRVLPRDGFDDEVMAIARRIAAGPTRAYGTAKRLIHMAANVERLDFHLDEELTELTRAAAGGDVAEGISAFLEKRAPAFRE
jgi:2-(1,2-epoxy-1,2-dihydrophenyl)acetyl-CoA isomerase